MKLYDYGSILLKTYIEIATSGNVSLLVISGSPSKDELFESWEKIVAENGRRNGDNQYDSYFQLIKGYAEIIAHHTIASSYLTILWYMQPGTTMTSSTGEQIRWFDVVEEIRERGYRIDTSGNEAYKNSIQSAMNKISNMITRAEMKRKELDRVFGKKTEGKENSQTYEEIIGHLELALERTILDAENLTLAKYNVLKQGIERKNKLKENAQRTNRAK